MYNKNQMAETSEASVDPESFFDVKEQIGKG